MSLLDKKNLNYLLTVEQFFLSKKDSGLALSANDYHLITQWEERGVPINVLCRAIDNGVRKSQQKNRGRPQKFSLIYLEEGIEQEIKKTQW